MTIQLNYADLIILVIVIAAVISGLIIWIKKSKNGGCASCSCDCKYNKNCKKKATS